MLETLVKFDITGEMIRFSNIYYVDGEIIIASHPDTGKPCLFYRNGKANFKNVRWALKQCGMKFGRQKVYKSIIYRELEAV